MQKQSGKLFQLYFASFPCPGTHPHKAGVFPAGMWHALTLHTAAVSVLVTHALMVHELDVGVKVHVNTLWIVQQHHE